MMRCTCPANMIDMNCPVHMRPKPTPPLALSAVERLMALLDENSRKRAPQSRVNLTVSEANHLVALLAAAEQREQAAVDDYNALLEMVQAQDTAIKRLSRRSLESREAEGWQKALDDLRAALAASQAEARDRAEHYAALREELAQANQTAADSKAFNAQMVARARSHVVDSIPAETHA